MALEQEIKLLVMSDDKLDLALLSDLLNLLEDDIVSAHLVSTYYDNDELYLSQQGLGLRLRQINESYWQTVKTAGTVNNGLHQREEWEYALEGPQWDLTTLKLTPLKSMIDDAELWSTLSPLFTTDFIRETVQLTLSEGTQIELAYDRGEVRSGGLKTAIHEVELELKAGNSEQLGILATHLRQQFLLKPSDISKAQMGYELVEQNRATTRR